MSMRTIFEIILVVIAGVAIWYASVPKKSPVGTYSIATVAPEIKAVPVETLTCRPVVVYRDAAKTDSGLPEGTISNQNDHVIAATIISSDRHPQTLVTVYDETTGKTESIVKIDPMPWMQALQTGYVGIGYGYTNGVTNKGYSVFAHEDLLAVKALRFGVDAALYSGGDTFVGVSGSWGW